MLSKHVGLGHPTLPLFHRYYDKKKSLIVKEQKTIDASGKALKSAEKKTIEILKQSKKVKTITKARKTYWSVKRLFVCLKRRFAGRLCF